MTFQILKECKDLLLGKLGIAVVLSYLVLVNVLVWIWPGWSYPSYGIGTPDVFFQISFYVLLFVTPGIAVGTLSNEFSSRTIELLAGLPTGWSKILGAKFIAGLVVLSIMILLTTPSLYVVYELHTTDTSPQSYQIIGSFVGLLLTGGFILALGLFTTCLVKKDIIAFIITIVVGYVLFDGLATLSGIESLPASISTALDYLSIQYHVANFSRGLITLSNIVYIASLTYFFFLLSKWIITHRLQ